MMSIKSAFKRMIGTQAEDGQAIVLIALFMVVMLAMVGVAIDGGGLFLLWRDAQNAADTAALQAAYDRCTSESDDPSVDTWIRTGERAADVNGFDAINNDIDDPDEEDFSPDVKVTVQETFLGNPSVGYVHVIIQADKPSYFIQLVYRGPLRVKAEALVYCSAAVDFSDLPGMIALGGCGCNGGNDNRFDFQGANFHFEGSVHSNCGAKINPAGTPGGVVDGDVDAVAGVTNTNDKTTVHGEEDDAADPVPLPAEIPIAMYFPEGEIFENVMEATYINGDYDFGDYVGEIQGLWAIEGDVTFPSAANSFTFGEKGLTVVSHGVIDYKNTRRATTDQNWHYYGHAYIGPSAAAPYNDPGVMISYSRGTGSGILGMTDWKPADEDACGSGANVTGFSFGGNGDDGDLDLWGVILARYSVVSWSGSSVKVKGNVIGMGIQNSGSDGHWIPDPNLLQPMAPIMQNADNG
jgi:hypothetical protein